MLSLTLRETINKLKDGSISAAELCEKCITRARRIQEFNFIVKDNFDQAQEESLQSSRLWSEYVSGRHHEWRKFSGIPFAIKDNFCTKDIRTTCASNILSNYVPPYTATVVQRLQDEGGVIIGKTNMDEFAMGSGSTDSIFGPVRNPWKYKFSQTDQSTDNLEGQAVADDWHIAGGSSGGSAVAVATGTCLGAFGSDTGGSTRNPAAYCGVVGFKATYGRLSRHGLIPLVNSLDVPGILTKSVDDANLIFNAVAGHDVRDSTTITDPFEKFTLPDDINVTNLHIGIPKEYHAPGLSPCVLDAWRRAADMFENAGAKVSQVSLPHTQYSIICYGVLCCAEVASNMSRYDGIEYGHRAKIEDSTEELYAATRHEGFNDVVRGRIFAGNFFLLRRNYDNFFIKAQKVRRLIADDFRNVFKGGVDILLTPTTLTEAPSYTWFTEEDNRTRAEEQDVFTQPINMAGVPAITVPASLSHSGLPIGLQFVGPNFHDRQVLTVAKWFEQQTNFKQLDLSYLDKS
ncbi:glutamyl-tRNA(Gln) amidotransferase subunit A, mitochondrial-like [Saccostrea echinata]|uniref:glutamyl-tRNA(Gln) amidotransferase subunit A, mitochondrial-like n=1 Tax=Saccostrea echinata TaxID=191078 RepID=UPI002A7FD30C|nr:glutamyl-tRNA(Gln) amidotransferase subunit A, mitochondrial-like [Saccostrea echinata]